MSEEMKVEEKQSTLPTDVAIDRTEFFIAELASMSSQHDKEILYYRNLATRVTILEQKGKSVGDDPEKMLGMFFLVMGVLQLIPMLIDVVKACRSSESLP
jgi:hypothetical protein